MSEGIFRTQESLWGCLQRIAIGKGRGKIPIPSQYYVSILKSATDNRVEFKFQLQIYNCNYYVLGSETASCCRNQSHFFFQEDLKYFEIEKVNEIMFWMHRESGLICMNLRVSSCPISRFSKGFVWLSVRNTFKSVMQDHAQSTKVVQTSCSVSFEGEEELESSSLARDCEEKHEIDEDSRVEEEVWVFLWIQNTGEKLPRLNCS